MGDGVVLFCALEQQAVVTEVVAVVRGEDLDGVVGQSRLISGFAYTADCIVDHSDHTAGQGAGFLCLTG